MNKLLLTIAFCFLLLQLMSAPTPGEWTWMHGVQGFGYTGNFGIQGVPSATNTPPCLYEGCEWTDQQGNFWMYGGQNGGAIFYSDMWKFDPATNEWTWMKGPGIVSQPGVYGTQGVSSPLNTPGGRGWAPTSWTDANNNLWMFGGNSSGGGDMNDLWMYNISTNEWTWMKGSSTGGSNGNTGTQGVPSITNEPACRHECACGWTDNSNRLWLFGAFGGGQTDDVWRYDIATNMWTWMTGTPLITVNPVWGTLGVASPTNTPGARASYSRWKDVSGNLWLWGGISYAIGSLNDLWKYDISTNNWTWMNGPNAPNVPGVYGIKCVSDANNLPPPRLENRSCWTDSCGDFWMFAGTDVTGSYPCRDDLWKYSPSTNEWVWVNGNTTLNGTGNFGTLGLSAPTNLPPSRFGSLSWTDNNGFMWIFGGNSSGGAGDRGDLWRYVPDPTCGGCLAAPPLANFIASDRHICPGTCIDFTNLSQGATSFQWYFAGGTPDTSTAMNPTNICYFNSGLYPVTLVATNLTGTDSVTLNNLIEVYPQPNAPTITQTGDTLFSSTGYGSYQWFFGSDSISGATNYFYVATQSGNYNLAVTDDNGCSVGAGIVNVVASLSSALSKGEVVSVFPNPARDRLYVTCNTLYGNEIALEIINSLGQQIYFSGEKITAGIFSREISLKDFADGIYVVQLHSESGVVSKRFVVMK